MVDSALTESNPEVVGFDDVKSDFVRVFCVLTTSIPTCKHVKNAYKFLIKELLKKIYS